MAPSAVTPAKYCSMSATVTVSLATATTSRWGWEIVQCTGMGAEYHRPRRCLSRSDHGKGKATLRFGAPDAACILGDRCALPLNDRMQWGPATMANPDPELLRLGEVLRLARERLALIIQTADDPAAIKAAQDLVRKP